jgi:hypothetical protein
MKKGFLKHILGDLFTTGGGMALGIPTIQEGLEVLPTDRTTGILKLVIGVGTLLLGLFSTTKNAE